MEVARHVHALVAVPTKKVTLRLLWWVAAAWWWLTKKREKKKKKVKQKKAEDEEVQGTKEGWGERMRIRVWDLVRPLSNDVDDENDHNMCQESHSFKTKHSLVTTNHQPA